MTSRKTVPGKTIPGTSSGSMRSTSASPSLPSPRSMQSQLSTSPIKKQLAFLPEEDISTYTTYPPCQHLTTVLSSSARDMVLKTFSTGMKICLMPSPSENQSYPSTSYYYTQDRKKVDPNDLIRLRSSILKCKDCLTADNVFMCLQCPHIGCLQDNHAFHHAKSVGHIFGIDPSSGRMICFKCRDYVSDPRLEKIRISQIRASGRVISFPGMSIYDREHDAETLRLVTTDSRLPTFKATTGLKGLINMGSTCFMSSIIQTIVHNPFIRDYFMSGSHLDCERGSDTCLSCCLGEIFQDFYTSTSTTGFGLTSLLIASWKVKRSLAGYSEQDAHEFWQFLVHQIHKNDTKSNRYKFNKELTPAFESTKLHQSKHENCDCITHKVFYGELQSTIICSNCHHERTTIDPMLDLSLEIQEKNPRDSTRVPLKTLEECLTKFTNPEKLDILYECVHCNKKTEVTKQLKIGKLPATLGIQLKRFEHLAVSSKIENHIEIPVMLDMSNYSAVVDGDSEYRGDKIYELFGVVCHIGSVNTGHYISMVKNRDGIWFKFDDAIVTMISQQSVLNSRAYLLYYIVHEM